MGERYFEFIVRGAGNFLFLEGIVRRLVVILISVSFVSSCATVPEQTYVERSRISKLNRVAVKVSYAGLDVKQARETGISVATAASFVFFGLLGFAVMAAEGAGKSSVDRQVADDIKKNTEKIEFDGMLRDYFIDNLRKANVFKLVGKPDATAPHGYAGLRDDGYDSLVELDIKELALRKDYTDKLKVYADVWGRMVDLQNGEVVWNRQEVVIDSDGQTIETYMADGGKLLKKSVDQGMKKIAARLTNDFVYSR